MEKNRKTFYTFDHSFGSKQNEIEFGDQNGVRGAENLTENSQTTFATINGLDNAILLFFISFHRWYFNLIFNFIRPDDDICQNIFAANFY